jgi:pyruvate/2-oxoglutarate dehydrogenase complex dihydrolipoamide acyltransferase (E2) component
MADVRFPRLSNDNPDAEGVVSTWFVNDGETVAAGQLLAEVAVDKVDQEVLAPASGTIAVAVAEGSVARQGAVIATIG